MDIETCILRFRDLVTDDGGTIARHKEIIDSKGYVWWGWWKKQQEKTPNEFSNLASIAAESGLKIYLVDSGLKKLYEANCCEIKATRRAPENAPEDAENTPEYYREKALFAWFKLSKIEETDSALVQRHTNVESSSLFADKTVNYSKFDNKKICTLDELIQQNRTVWFIRPFAEGDKDEEIILLNSAYVQPSNYSATYYQAAGDTLLWLSDLHLADNVFPSRASGGKTLSDHICKLTEGVSIAGLAISGDITSRATAAGYDQAKELIRDISSEKSLLNAENIIICPGNHDFGFSRSKLQEGKQPAYYHSVKQSTELYRKFYNAIYKILPNRYFSCGKKLLLSSGHLVEILSLNSVMLRQYPNFEGNGLITTEQMDFAAKEMGWDKDCTDRVIRIVMMHHHYLPTCFNETINPCRGSSAVYDADELMQWLVKHSVKVLLHGHKHRSRITRLLYPNQKNSGNIYLGDFKPVIVAGMGGTAASDNENVFTTIRFEGNEIVFKRFLMYHDSISEDRELETITLPLT